MFIIPASFGRLRLLRWNDFWSVPFFDAFPDESLAHFIPRLWELSLSISERTLKTVFQLCFMTKKFVWLPNLDCLWTKWLSDDKMIHFQVQLKTNIGLQMQLDFENRDMH